MNSLIAKMILSILVAALLGEIVCFDVSFGNGGGKINGLTIADNIKPTGENFFALTGPTSFGSRLIRADEKAENIKSWSATIDCSFGAVEKRRYLRGLAFWCTKDALPSSPSNGAATAFGMPTRWNGLGIFVEPRDDSKISIKAVWNNGSTVYNPSVQSHTNYHFASTERPIDAAFC